MSTIRATDDAAGATALAGRYLTFRSGTESFGIPVLGVREIIRQAPITTVPKMPGHVRGVLNLRGRIVPVLDLKQRFGTGASEIGDRTCIVVVQVSSTGGAAVQVGLIVDAVEEVVSVAPDNVSAVPNFGVNVDTSFLLGMARINGAVKSLLNLERVLTDTEAAETAGFAAAS